MGKYQASVGLKMFWAATYAMSSATEIDGLTDTPDKGGDANDITVNIISQKEVTHLAGQTDGGGLMEYTFVPDFTPSTGNVAVIHNAMQQSGAIWFYEEYAEGSMSSDQTPTYQPGPGFLYKGKIKSIKAGGQSGNSAQSGTFTIEREGTIYESTGGASPTYKDFFTGKAASLS